MQYYSVPDSPVTSYKDPTELNRNRRHDSDQGGRKILSSSALNRITETLGALNQVGRLLVNMTRGDDGIANKQSSLEEEQEQPEEDDEEEEDDGFISPVSWFSDDDDDDEDDYSEESNEDAQKKKKEQKGKQSTTTPRVTTTEKTTTTKSPVIEQRLDDIPEAQVTLTSSGAAKNLTETIEPLFQRVTTTPSDGNSAESEGKKPKTKTKTNKKKKRENEKAKPTVASTTTSTTTRRTTTTLSTTTATAAPVASFLQNVPNVVPTPTGKLKITWLRNSFS